MVGDVGHHGDQGGGVTRSVSYTFEDVELEQKDTEAEGVVYSGKRGGVDRAGRASATRRTSAA